MTWFPEFCPTKQGFGLRPSPQWDQRIRTRACICVSKFSSFLYYAVQLHASVWTPRYWNVCATVRTYLFSLCSVCVIRRVCHHSEAAVVLSRHGVCLRICVCWPYLLSFFSYFQCVHPMCACITRLQPANMHSFPPASKMELILWRPCCDLDEPSWHIKPAFCLCAGACFQYAYVCLKCPTSLL